MDFERLVELVKEKIRDKIVTELVNLKVPDELISQKIDEIVEVINHWVEGNITDFEFYKGLSGILLKLPVRQPSAMAEGIVEWAKDLVRPLVEVKATGSVLEDVVKRVVKELKDKGEL